jgi:hypothetical protein
VVVDVDTDAGVGGSGGSQPAAEETSGKTGSQWVPSFEMIPNGLPITTEDSCGADAGVALGVLKAAALPRDVLDVSGNPFVAVGRLAQLFTLVSFYLFPFGTSFSVPCKHKFPCLYFSTV